MQEDTDSELLVRLRAGDEQAFGILVRRHHAAMLRLASGYVPNLAVAEEVVQDTWLGVLRGLDGFEGRSSVRTWLFRILVNRARTAGRLRLLPLPRRRDIVCQQAVELVTDYLEGALSRADRRRFEAHLNGCPHCTEYLAQMRATIELAGRVTPEDLTPQMQDEFIALYRQWRADHDEGG